MARKYQKQSGWLSFFRRPKARRYRDDYEAGDANAILSTISNLDPEVKKGIFIICLFALAALSTMGLFDLSGKFGQWTNYILSIGMGNLKWIFPLLLGAWIFCLLNEEKYPIRLINYFGVALLVLGLAGFFHLPYESWESLEAAKLGHGGGYLGVMAALPLLRLMNFLGAMVVLLALVLIGILLALETSIYGFMWPIKAFGWLSEKIKNYYFYHKLKKQELQLAEQTNDGYEEEVAEPEDQPMITEEEIQPADEEEETPGFVKTEIKMGFDKEPSFVAEPQNKIKKYGPIDIPVGLLNSKSGKATFGDIKNNQEAIRKTLHNFGIAVEMGDVNVGPTVTQFTMRPADGVRLAKIATLNADLALALAAHPIRIEAPIPGKSLVGIEVPNVQAAKVTMGEMLLSKEYTARTTNLFIALGKDVSGKPIFAQLDKMPHLLVAGSTNSGKSVCINSIIVSLMYQNSPDELKFIMVDPKRVELQAYNGIPYLLTPVITDVKKTVGALKWAITEMERRFELLSKYGNRNIASYNQSHADKLPYIVIIIDELADLMATAGNDMEAGIVRLAQMARAIGIHLILATQRPSTEVITGLIKANIPARIAFSVASSIDSRTVLDGAGAEKLVGRGDMLYLGPEMSRPRRIQGVFLADKEISDVCRFIKSHGEAEYDEKLMGSGSAIGGGMGGSFGNSDEPLMNEAIEVIRESGKASASLLQRRLKLGYARAARILDLLEEQGIIGPSDGAKAREIFLDKLGGVGVVEFSAREHNLTGEMRPISSIIRNEEPAFAEGLASEDEPTFTSFGRGQFASVDEDESTTADAYADEEIEDDDEAPPVFSSHDLDDEDIDDTASDTADALAEELDTVAKQELVEAIENEIESIAEEAPVVIKVRAKKVEPAPIKTRKNFFSDEEWS